VSDVTARLYTLVDSVHFESPDRYAPSDEYGAVVRSCLPSGWGVQPRGFWTFCRPPQDVALPHGWKIHLSCIPENAEQTLAVMTPVVVEAGVSFKFCSDPFMLGLSLGKGWSRFQAGKFITIYPRDRQQFQELLERLYQVTQGLSGPHVLTDRAYRDSTVVYYRYGAHAGVSRPDPYGSLQQGYLLADGTWHEDVRGAGFRLPPGVDDPCVAAAAAPTPAGPIVLNGRYQVHGVLKFNGTGGIYRGRDTTTGQKVVIREVRGFSDADGAELVNGMVNGIKREARILQKLSATGLVPVFVELFKEWNNWFLVQEQLDAISLWDSAMAFYFAEDEQRACDGFERIRRRISQIAEALQVVHEHGVVLRDLTRSNVMFTAAGEVKFIDLEFAHEIGHDSHWAKGWTPGYASQEQLQAQRPTVQEDHHALGALIFDMITFCASGLDLSRDALLEHKFKQVLGDLGLPMDLHDIVVGLTHQDPGQRWDIGRALRHLRTAPSPQSGVLMFPTRSALLAAPPAAAQTERRIAAVLEGYERYLSSTCDLSRADRLWPAGLQMFMTNPVSLQFGATGVAFFLLRRTGTLAPGVLDWIENAATPQRCPSGLYSGRGGVALLLICAGRHEAAHRLLDEVNEDASALLLPGLYFGAAGVGLLNLHAWQGLGDPTHLAVAARIGDTLLAAGQRAPQGRYWKAGDRTGLGLGDGQSGIALFLTYLGKVTGDRRYLAAAAEALDFDIAHGLRIAGRLVWPTHVEGAAGAPASPHTRFGSAGVGMACLRHYVATGTERFRDVALDCAHSVRPRITNKIWQDSGNAGFGEYLLDLACLLQDERFSNAAYYQAEAILPHALDCEGGVAFAGPAHYRICNDYGMGGSGIGIFLDRLLSRRSRFLMLDELLGVRAC